MTTTDLSESRILIVDDVAANIHILVEALKDEYKLAVARDGESALRAVAKSPPDLLLLDIMMPGIDGYEVCRRLRADEATRELPIMFLSSLEEVADKARGFELGANDYLTKPFEILEVKARVRSLVKAKAFADAVREAREREMNIAREIQIGLLPADLEVRTAGTGLSVHAVMEAAKHVGGDLYEVLHRDDGCVVVVVGDVMGKGVPAAIFMAMTMTLLRTLAKHFRQPEEILRRLNDELVAQNPRRLFVTLSCVVIDLSSGEVVGASAGHLPLYLVPAQGEPRPVFPSSGPVAGLIPGRPYGRAQLTLSPGDQLLLYSDGVTEAENPAEEQFGDERLERCLANCRLRRPEETVRSVLSEVRGFAAGAAQNDDITIVALRYDPPSRFS
jgi:sigma-B regulation protein RsbU (phosphoserine phosphatase)